MNSGQRVFRVFLRTALAAIPSALAVIILTFFLLRLAPGDAADVLAGESGSATAETMAQLRRRFGLDLPVFAQLQNYLLSLAQGSLGFSPRYNMPVTQLIFQRLPGTLMLMGLALGFAILLGLALGAIMAMHAGRWPDRLISILSLLLYSVPGFWIGLMLIVLFSVKLGWLPSGGAETIGADLKGLAYAWDRFKHMILPALSLSLFFVAVYARLTRAAVIEASSQDFVRTARAKGLPPFTVGARHILRNALIPVTTLAGMHIGGILGGAVVAETVFSWPGLGRLAFEAVLQRDFNVLLGVLLLSSFLVILANMLVDLLQAWLDPRIEL